MFSLPLAVLGWPILVDRVVLLPLDALEAFNLFGRGPHKGVLAGRVVWRRGARRLTLALAFSSAARRYWLGVFPTLRREISCLRRRALRIPGTELRLEAIHNLKAQEGNLEGAARRY